MFRKVIGGFILFSFLLVNVAALSASTFMKEIVEHSLIKSNEKTEKNADEEELKLVELDEFLNPTLLIVSGLNNDKVYKYIYYFDSILNTHISLPYPPPNFLA